VSLCSPPLTDTLSACTNLGGKCMYSANTTCNGMGPPGSCAYSDEVCCLSAPFDAGPDAGECAPDGSIFVACNEDAGARDAAGE
jgi:hypothetical protein